jgi:hypothetical protein
LTDLVCRLLDAELKNICFGVVAGDDVECVWRGGGSGRWIGRLVWIIITDILLESIEI